MPREIGELVRRMLLPDPARRLSDLQAIAEMLRAQAE
jgi:hypothetical protein